MNIYRNQRINLVNRPKSRFSIVSNEIIDNLWLRDMDGQVFLELALNLIGNYDFDRKYLREIDEYTFELKTKDGKSVKVQVECGSIDDCPQIKVTEDNIEMSYDYIPVSGDDNLLYFNTTQERNIKTGFIQYYNGGYDKMLMEKDGIVTIIYLYCPHPPATYDERECSTYFASNKLKEAIKQADSSDVIELYNVITENLDDDIKSFEIKMYEDKSYKILNDIVVSNNIIEYILLTKKYADGSVTIEEDNRNRERFSVNIDNVRIDYNDTMQKFGTLKRTLEKRLTKEDN